MPPFGLTQAEMDFIHHFRRESLALEVGPAREWFRFNEIYESVMIPLPYNDQENNPRWLDRLYEHPAPEFTPSWSSREEFERRVWAALEAYPKLNDQSYVIPGYQPRIGLEPHSHPSTPRTPPVGR